MKFQESYGLRRSNWNWSQIVKGVIAEHINQIQSQGNEHDLDVSHVEIIWHTFVKVMGIHDLQEIPQCNDIEHPHVKTILFMYSLESFLFKKINLSSRERDLSVVKNLGPYAVALTRTINNVQKHR